MYIVLFSIDLAPISFNKCCDQSWQYR